VGGFVIGNAGFATLGTVGAIAAGCALTLALVAGSKIPARS
jgi:predicted MFS family arabinose efflux permease